MKSLIPAHLLRHEHRRGDSRDLLVHIRTMSREHLSRFVHKQCRSDLADAHVDVAWDVLSGFVDSGKFVRSTFMYLGWRSGADEDDSALRASASLELLHAFALMQDDVMDESALRRGRPAAHIQFARWHLNSGMPGCSNRFGESAATLLGDLCLVWSSQMLRESGVGADRLARVWARYDEMRTELAVGQFADLVNDARSFPTFDDVLDVLRRKSGNYTVRRPLEIGAAMAGCTPQVISALGRYGTVVGEAFQLRDDLLGVSGVPTVTGKPVGADLKAKKATSVVVAAHRMADSDTRRQLEELMSAPTLSTADAHRWQSLIRSSGAVEWVEQCIGERSIRAASYLECADIPDQVRAALEEMTIACTERAN